MNYFDYAASSLIYPEVLTDLEKNQHKDFANPSARHLLGQDLREKIEFYRNDFLSKLGAKKDDSFIFTSSATESNNTIIRGLTLDEGDVILYSPADHPSLTSTVQDLSERFKKVVLKKIILRPNGTIDEEGLRSLLSDNVKLVLFTHVNNQSGVIQDIKSLTAMVKEKVPAHVHVDAVQSFGKIALKAYSGIDSISITSHKIGGPKGVAGLFMKKGHRVKPLLTGGGQEGGFRSGTESYPLIAAFHQAADISLMRLEASRLKSESLMKKIRQGISSSIPVVSSAFAQTSPYIYSFVLPGITSDVILRHLEVRRVFISSTSACSSRIVGYSPSLEALHIPEQFHKNFLRISLGPQTTEKEVDVLLHEFLNVWNDVKTYAEKIIRR